MRALRPHPSTPEGAWSVAARADRTYGGELRLRWVLQGALGGVRVPEPGQVRRGTDLWKHTCFEAFVAAEGKPGYVELNFSPSCEWAAYAFARYREGGPLTDSRLVPTIVVRRESDAIVLDALIELEELSVSYRDAVLRVGLSAVVEATSGRASYWALFHPVGRPDFHHDDAFAIRLEPRTDTSGGPGA